MKGISTILAMILIVIIVVALIGMTYTFAVGLFSTTSNSATNQVDTTTTRMDKVISLVGVESCKNTTAAKTIWNITFTAKHAGVTNLINSPTANELSALIDSTVVDLSTSYPNLGTTVLSPGDVKTYTIKDFATTVGAHTLTILSPAGEAPVRITCA
jgi:hypothetical protein